jgi:hypothetical protein
MKDRLIDTAALIGLLLLGWLAFSRFDVLYDASVCWTSC